jgi:hypothetical protein
MRIAVLLLLSSALLTSSATAAQQISFWISSVYEAVPDEATPFKDFRLSISEAAYILQPPSDVAELWYATDGPAAAAFFAALTNGVNDPITFSNGSFEYVIDENTYFDGVDGTAPQIGLGVWPEYTAGRTDLHGYSVDYIDIQFTRESFSGVLYQRYIVHVWGTVPEPSTLLLALAGFSLLGIRRR